MELELFSSNFWIALGGAYCLGISKCGLPGMAIVNVLVAAHIFGAKPSVGIVLPLLVVCDIIVFPMFRKHSSWRAVLPIFLATVLGILVGWRVLAWLDSETMRPVIGVVILVMVTLQIIRSRRQSFLQSLPDAKLFLVLAGVTIGFATMMANAAGPVFAIYALIHRMPKEEFLGLGARLFLVVNLFKVPFLVEQNLIHADSLAIDAVLLPGLLLGLFSGRKIIALIPQQLFECLLYFFSIVAALRMLW